MPLVLAAPAVAGGVATDLAAQLRTTGLDAEQCYRVREITLVKEDIRLYLTDGYLIFGNELDGKGYSAVFSGDVEGGDGEILVMPPQRNERLSMATFTDSPNLNEHFRFALMVFSDDTARTLLEAVRRQASERRSPERGLLLASRYGSVVDNIARSFGTRLVYDILSQRPAEEGFFYSALRGVHYGNFDVVYDPASFEQIRVGQVRRRDDRPFFDVWTSFESRSFRNGSRPLVRSGYALGDYRINATLEPDLLLRATTDAVLNIDQAPRRVLSFDISPHVVVSEVTIDGRACEIWQRSALRANLFGGGTGLFLVVATEPLAPGAHSIRFRHQGRVVRDAGNGVYYVGARGSWYPHHGLVFSHFDVTFRHPAGLDLVFAGKLLEDREDGEWRIVRRRIQNPVRLFGFNVGRYERIKVDREGFSIEVYANTQVEQALERPQEIVILPQRPLYPGSRRRDAPQLVAVPMHTERRDPTARLEPLAEEVADAFEFMKSLFGDPPTRTLMVSPIPGSFGQGFPGLLYLSTISYLEPEERPKASRDRFQDIFYSELLHAHETAHQWWGNIVTSEGYQSSWIMEALANYSALLMLERNKGPEALDTVLDTYRGNLLKTNGEGKTLESAGPITWGLRLNSSQARAYQLITYEKGSWIIHMIRRRLGDERFLKMLGTLCRQYRHKTLTTELFRRHVAEFAPPDFPDRSFENFFEQWVYDIGVPRLRFTHRIRGRKPRVRFTGTVRQSGVPSQFSTLVPVEIHLRGGKSMLRWIRTGEEDSSIDITLPEPPIEVVFNPGRSTLAAPE